MGFHHVGQAVTSGDPPTSASQSAGITGMSRHARPVVVVFAVCFSVLFVFEEGDKARSTGSAMSLEALLPLHPPGLTWFSLFVWFVFVFV